MIFALENGYDLAQYGILGIIVLALVAGRVRPEIEIKFREQIIAKQEEELALLRKAMEEQVIPALISSTEVLKRFAEKTRDNVVPLRRVDERE